MVNQSHTHIPPVHIPLQGEGFPNNQDATGHVDVTSMPS